MSNVNLLTIGGLDFSSIIRAETYKIIPNARQDVDSYRDANGLLHRNTVTHTATTIQFNLIPMKQAQMKQIMSALNSAYSSKTERKCTIQYYDPESGGYKSGEFYLGANHPVFEIYGTYKNEIFYKETEFKFIEY